MKKTVSILALLAVMLLCSMGVRAEQPIHLNFSPTCVGQLVYIRPGSKYYESSQNFGSGEYKVVDENNKCIPRSGIAAVTGVAYLDENGNVTRSYVSSFGEVSRRAIPIDRERPHMLLLFTELYFLGWINPEDVLALDEAPPVTYDPIEGFENGYEHGVQLHY